MTDRPIIFTDTVPALRAGRKTQTRRMNGLKKINEAPDTWTLIGQQEGEFIFSRINHGDTRVPIRCPYGAPGDLLWVREAWITLVEWDGLPPAEISAMWGRKTETFPIWYCADGLNEPSVSGVSGKARSPMFLPRRFSRDLLEVISVRPERLRVITREDCLAEGIRYDPPFSGQNGCAPALYSHGTTDGFPTAKDAYHALWNSVNGKTFPWDKNPWVWRVEFRRLTQ